MNVTADQARESLRADCRRGGFGSRRTGISRNRRSGGSVSLVPRHPVSVLMRSLLGCLLFESLPACADAAQFAFDGADGTLLLGGDLFVGVAVHFQGGDLVEGGIVEGFKEVAAVFGKHGGQFGRGFVAEELLESGGSFVIGVAQEDRFTADLSLSSFLCPVASCLGEGLMGSDGYEDLPEVVAIIEFRVAPSSGAGEEAVDGAEGNVFFIHDSAGHAVEFASSKSHEFFEVVFPDDLDGIGVVFGEALEPLGDFVGGHGWFFASGPW